MELVDKFLNKNYKKLFLGLFENGSLEKILKYETLEGCNTYIHLLQGLRNKCMIIKGNKKTIIINDC